MTGSHKNMRLCLMNTRGLIQVFKIKAIPCLDSCALEHQVSVADLVKGQEQNTVVESIAILDDESLIVALSNHTKFIYDVPSKCWKSIPFDIQLTNNTEQRPSIRTAHGYEMNSSSNERGEKCFDFQSLIGELEETAKPLSQTM